MFAHWNWELRKHATHCGKSFTIVSCCLMQSIITFISDHYHSLFSHVKSSSRPSHHVIHFLGHFLFSHSLLSCHITLISLWASLILCNLITWICKSRRKPSYSHLIMPTTSHIILSQSRERSRRKAFSYFHHTCKQHKAIYKVLELLFTCRLALIEKRKREVKKMRWREEREMCCIHDNHAHVMCVSLSVWKLLDSGLDWM
jgi:hypothetical protein